MSRATIQDLRDWGITRKEWVAEYGFQGLWWGDRCGCTDDRCIGYHHEYEGNCGCLDVLAREYIERRRSGREAVA